MNRTILHQITILMGLLSFSASLCAVVIDTNSLATRYELEGVLTDASQGGVAVIKDKYSNKKIFRRVGERLEDDIYVKDVQARGIVLSNGTRSVRLNFDPFRSTQGSNTSNYANAKSNTDTSSKQAKATFGGANASGKIPNGADIDWDAESFDPNSQYMGDDDFYDLGEEDEARLKQLQEYYDDSASFSPEATKKLSAPTTPRWNN